MATRLWCWDGGGNEDGSLEGLRVIYERQAVAIRAGDRAAEGVRWQR